MYGQETSIDEKVLREAVTDVYLKHKGTWESSIKKVNKQAKLHYTKHIPMSWIKDARVYFGKHSDYVNISTDYGDDKKSSVDGGVIYVELFNIKLPLGWFEVKSSNSCKKHKARGQATGLITEQESRCRSWCSPILNQVKPLVAFMHGEDFNPENGNYNIDRIKMDLHTAGNCSPYVENVTDCVSWLFYSKSFSQERLEEIIFDVINTNIEKMKDVIKNF